MEYVFIGDLERRHYGDEGMAEFASFMDVAFEKSEVTICRTRAEPSPSPSAGGDRLLLAVASK